MLNLNEQLSSAALNVEPVWKVIIDFFNVIIVFVWKMLFIIYNSLVLILNLKLKILKNSVFCSLGPCL